MLLPLVRRVTPCVLAVLLLASSGCTLSTTATPAQGEVWVMPPSSTADQVVSVRLSGLPASTPVVVSLSSVDAHQVRWASAATFRSDARGSLDLDTAPAVSGSYTGADGMGLFWSLRPSDEDAAAGHGFYFWSDAPTFALRAEVSGRAVAHTTFERRLTRGPSQRRALTVAANGFSGTFTWSAKPPGRRPAVLLLGGSEGGEPGPLAAEALADRGYAVLTAAYFGAPGLPRTLSKIPLEYFATALTWLGAQPQVDARRIVVLGVSRGSEAALLLGVHYPKAVRAVVAGVPSSVALCSYPDCSGAAWTLHGRDLPFTREYNEPRPADQPDAVIPVERIRGRVLLACGGRDQVWQSCSFAHAIVERRKAHGVPQGDTLSEFPLAGHAVGVFFPYEPRADHSSMTFADDERALGKAWPALLAFLAEATAPNAGR